MKRFFLLVVAVLAPVGLVLIGVWLTWEPGLPAQAQVSLRYYLQANPAVQGYQVQQVDKAQRPWQLMPAVSGPIFGDDSYFRTTQIQLSAAPLRSLVDTRPNSPEGVTGDFFRALPYPPRELWCVALGGAMAATTRVVYVALHEDLYVARWYVHDPPPGITGDELRAEIEMFGCSPIVQGENQP